MTKFGIVIFALLAFYPMAVDAHQWTPTYVKFTPSYVDGVVQTRLKLFNTRKDVDYYEIEVLDEKMNPIDFATTDRIIHAPYLSKKTIDVYISARDFSRVGYVCSRSKLLVDNQTGASVSSRVCSKVRNEILLTSYFIG